MTSVPAVSRHDVALSAASIRYLLLATAATATGGFLFGYDTAVINGAISYLRAHLHLTSVQEGMAGGSAILGCIPGAMFAGALSDRYGRKRLLFMCAVLYAVSGVLSAVPRTFDEFLTARFLSGLGIGVSSLVCPIYIAEISPSKWRGRLGTLFQLGIVAGIFLTLFINRVVQGWGNEAWDTSTGWRWMLGLEVVPAVVFVALLFLVPESPRWLVLHGREDEADTVLTRIGGVDYSRAEQSAIKAAMATEDGRFAELFSRAHFRPLLIAVVLMVGSQLCGINAIIYYSTKIFESSGAGSHAAFTSTVWMGFVNLVFTLVAVALVDHLGRRPLFLVGTALQTIALGLIGWMFHLHHSGLALLACIVMFTASFAISSGPLVWLICSEIFPNKVRGRAMSAATFTIWAACYVVAQTFPVLNDSRRVGPALTFWLYGLVSLGSFLFILKFVPETKGRSLEEIEAGWQRAL